MMKKNLFTKNKKTLVLCTMLSLSFSFLSAQNEGIRETQLYAHGSQSAQYAEDSNAAGDLESAETASTKKSAKKSTKKTAEEKAREKELAKQQKEDEKKRKAEEKARKKILAKQKKDKYTGWVYIPETKFSITNGNVKVVMNGKTGSFGFYAIPENLKQVALLSAIDAYSSTYFSVKVGRKEYRLNRENGVKSEARRTPYGAQMSYTIPKKAQVVVDFSFLPSIATSSRVDMLRVTVYTINLSSHTQSFAIKGVFDTLLGENTMTHFSTAARRKINSEVQFLNMADDLWVRSANEETSVQFLLSGKGISKPSYVTLSNKDQLSQPGWIPTVHEDKSFNSVLAYNNSSLAVNWKTSYLDPLKTDVITFYLSVGTDGNEPAGKDFLQALAAGKTALSAKLPEFVATTNVGPEPSQVGEDVLETSYYENMPVVPGNPNVPINEVVKPSSSRPDPEEAEGLYIPERDVSAENADNSEPVSSDTQVLAHEPSREAIINDPELDPEYIQSIIDRVAELENDSSVTNIAEIEELNAVLDRIFEKLRNLE